MKRIISELKQFNNASGEEELSVSDLNGIITQKKFLEQLINNKTRVIQRAINKVDNTVKPDLTKLLAEIKELKNRLSGINLEKIITISNKYHSMRIRAESKQVTKNYLDRLKKRKESLADTFNKMRVIDNYDFTKTITSIGEEIEGLKSNQLSNDKRLIKQFSNNMNSLLKEEMILRNYKALSSKQQRRISKLINENKELIRQAASIRKQRLITNNQAYKLKKLLERIVNNHQLIKSELIKPDKVIKFISELTVNYVPTIFKERDEGSNYYAMLSTSTNTYRMDLSKKIYSIKPLDINASRVLLAYHNGLLKPRVKGLKINQLIKSEYLNKTMIKGLFAGRFIFNNKWFVIILIEKEAYKRLIDKIRIKNKQLIIDKRFNACLMCYADKDLNTKNLGVNFLNSLSESLKIIN